MWVGRVRPDYTRGSKVGEVKDRKSPVTAPELKRLADRGVYEIDSKGGFTGPTVKAGKVRRIKLSPRRRTAG